MPSPGAQPVKDYDALDLGRGDDGVWRVATRYDDGSYVVWNGDPPNEELAYIEPGRTDPVDIGGGQAAVVRPDMAVDVFPIANPPPQYSGAPEGAAPAAPAAPVNPNAPTGPVGTRLPGQDFNYGPTRPGAGVYPGAAAFPGQVVPGRPTDVPFGTHVSPSTWNPAMPSQGRREGWGTIGAGTEGIPYGWGVPGFGKDPIKIREEYLDNLFDPKVAPGYLPGSGTYNQYALDKPGLFGTIPGQQGEVNLRYGLGGTGDPTTGHEIQTPDRWITGDPNASRVAQQGDLYARGLKPLLGGGGWDNAWAGAAPRYTPGPGVSAPTGGLGAAGYGATGWQTMPSGVDVRQRGAGGGYDAQGGGMGGGFFAPGPGYSPSELGALWGKEPKTAGLDYLITNFMRSDTPTGISTAAWGAPQQMWDGLIAAIRQGIVRVADPQAWEMLRQKNPAYTPQSIGGAALTGAQPGGSSTEDAIANGNAAEAADRAAYWAYQQALLRQGDERIALEEARSAWQKEYESKRLQFEQAGLTGTLDGQQTLAAQQQAWNQKFQEQSQQNQTALSLMQLQSSLQGPRNWARYQSTFNSTPQGLQDVIGAFQGKYQLPGATGAQAQAQGGRQSVAGLAGDILSGTYGQDGQTGGQAAALANPRQADLQNWARMQPSQREMVLGQYEDQGWYGPDVENLIKGAAPKYAGPRTSSYNFFQA